MKKVLLAAALIATLGMVGIQQAGARGPGGYGGPGDCWQGRGGAAVQTMDEKTLKKYDAFRADTTELRKEMAVKRAQMSALMHSDNPDEGKAGDIAATLFDLRTQMQAKADEVGLQGFGPGYGRGCDGPGDCFRGKGGGQGYGRGCDGPGDCYRGKGGRW